MITVGSPLPEFALEDVHGDRLHSGDFTQQWIVLLFATQQSIKMIDEWYNTLVETFPKEQVATLAIAILNQLPSFVPESAIKVRLKQKTKTPLLMDMKGNVAMRFGIVEDGAYIVVVEPGQTITFTGTTLDSAMAYLPL
ncbi:MAG: redoxin domain-containing protein [Chloroflexota bacterium]